jgi:hypothetical protein
VPTSFRKQLDNLSACSKLREPLNFCWLFQDLEEKPNFTKILRNLLISLGMDNLQLTGQNLGWVFNFINGHEHAVHLLCYQVKLPNLKLKAQPKQLLGSLPLDIVFPGMSQHNIWLIQL